MLSVLSRLGRKEGLRSLLGRLHRDERGVEGVEKLLIFAAIVLPILGILIFFKDDLVEWVSDKWTGIKDQSEDVTEPNI